MRSCVLPTLLITFAAASASVGSARTRPDFSGEWIRADSATEERSVAAVGDGAFRVGTMGTGWGSPLTLRQQANQLVVEYTFFSTYDLQAPIRLVYALDGSESRNAIMIGHSESMPRSRVRWIGDTLVITTEYHAPAGAKNAVVRQALSLASPRSLAVETTRSAGTGTSESVTRSTYSKR
jgi:hypothetical protein